MNSRGRLCVHRTKDGLSSSYLINGSFNVHTLCIVSDSNFDYLFFVMSSMIPKGSLVLVTGVNGFIAAQTAKQFLELGYKVRGTVRSQTKSKWLVDDAFRAETSSGAFELVTVEDIAKENAFQDAVRGVSSIIHVATIASLDPDPHNVVPQTIAAVVNLLKDAVKEPSVKSFVFTSSLGAAGMPLTDVPFEITKDSWNDMAVSLAWAPSPYETERGLVTYMASKVEAEKAFWKFVEDEKPSFTANTVLPFTTFGPLLSAQQTGSTSAWLCSLYRGDASAAGLLKAG